MLNNKYFSSGKKIGSLEAIFLISIIAGFVGAIIKIESDSIDLSGNETAAVIYFPRSASRSASTIINAESISVTMKYISEGYILAEAPDNSGVTQIDIFDGESLKISCFDGAFCAYKPSSSSHDISAKAYDAAGNFGTAEIVVR